MEWQNHHGPICYLNKALPTALTAAAVSWERAKFCPFFFKFSCHLIMQAERIYQQIKGFCFPLPFLFKLKLKIFPPGCWVVHFRNAAALCGFLRLICIQRIINSVAKAEQWNTSAGWNGQLFILGPSRSRAVVVQSDTLLVQTAAAAVFFFSFIVLWMSLMFYFIHFSIHCSCFTTSATYYICMEKHEAQWIRCHSH